MQIDRFETHDRFLEYKKQSHDISECCQDIINKRPFGNYPFYIFAHARTIGLDEKYKLFLSGAYTSFEKVPEKTIIWQPRLTKPKPQTNSMLFKAYPGTDLLKVLWMIPDQALWAQYEKGNITESDICAWSIDQFKTNREFLGKKEDDDFDDETIDRIYREISMEASRDKRMKDLYGPKPDSSGASSLIF